jgi:hypothetical protein
MERVLAAAALAFALGPAAVRAEEPASPPPAAPSDRPNEEDMFGGENAPAAETPAASSTATATAPAPASQAPPEDPLKIGGVFYLRGAASAQVDVPWNETRLSAPLIVDGYFDARPNDRLRGMVVGRLSFDPTVDPNAAGVLGLLGGAAPPNPRVVLDQMWLRFDIARTVFVTAGKQHVKWGTARFWNPTDYLHSERKDPLTQFDLRTGTTMLKLHVPWEERGWNFYALALLDAFEPARMLERVGGAFRAEMVIGTAELGIDAVVQQFRNPRFGVDLSAGLGPFDVYVEVGAREAGDTQRWRKVADPDPALGLLGEYEAYLPAGWTAAASAGARTEVQISDTDAISFGAEYFYNPSGYDDAKIYPWLLFKGDFQPFYTGQHYAAVYAYMIGPGTWDDTAIVLSTLANISDGSVISRLDVSNTILTHLRVEFFAAVHYGNKGGEFRLEIDVPSLNLGGTTIPPIFVSAPLLDLGVALRINI